MTLEEIKNLDIRYLSLSHYIHYRLINGGFLTVGDILSIKIDDILRVPGIGMSTVKAVREAIRKKLQIDWD